MNANQPIPCRGNMNFCFMMYPWDKVEPESDSTLRLIHQAVLNGHVVGLICPNNLTIRASVTYGFCRIIEPMENVPAKPQTFYKKVKFREQLLPLGGFDGIFIRTNPPLDNLMLNFLDSVQDDTFIVNHIDGLRKASNKLYTAAFDGALIPDTHVSKNKDYLKRIIDESTDERMILKPLDGFGGNGVIVLEKSATQNISSLLDFYIGQEPSSNYVILQEMVEGAEEGDIRILLLNGEPIGAMRRVPAEGEFRSNVHVGGRVVKHVLNKEQKRLCKKVGQKLVKDGFFFVGLDLIGDKLIEVNVCSPGGITRINKLNRVNLQQQILAFVEEEVSLRNNARSRKSTFQMTVSNAKSIG